MLLSHFLMQLFQIPSSTGRRRKKLFELFHVWDFLFVSQRGVSGNATSEEYLLWGTTHPLWVKSWTQQGKLMKNSPKLFACLLQGYDVEEIQPAHHMCCWLDFQNYLSLHVKDILKKISKAEWFNNSVPSFTPGNVEHQKYLTLKSHS